MYLCTKSDSVLTKNRVNKTLAREKHRKNKCQKYHQQMKMYPYGKFHSVCLTKIFRLNLPPKNQMKKSEKQCHNGNWFVIMCHCVKFQLI